MKEIILAGAGGCMRELVWQIQELNKKVSTWKIVGFVDKTPPENTKCVKVGTEEIPYLGDDDYLLQQTTDCNIAICTGEPSLRKKIATKLMVNPKLHFPNLILSKTSICEDVRMGQGCIISMGVEISTNVTIGDFAFLNLHSGICHDGNLGDYVTLSPDVRLAGNVTVKDGCDLGLGTKVIQGVTIGENTRTGAGSVVVRDIAGNCTVMGVPAKERK